MVHPKFKVYAALHEHIGEGFVWLKKADLPARCVVIITNPTNGRSVHCEALQLDDNFLDRYNKAKRFTIDNPDSSIVIGAWYRARLGDLNTQASYPLKIENANNCWAKLRASLGHPQVVVRLATRLGVWSVILGMIGIILGIISIWPKK